MLANKFLDDNTFTNKTWSDISGMKMYELNVMEFEFLDVLRYALFIPKVDFDHWKTTLFNFRNKLYDPAMNDVTRRGPQHQQLIESTLKNMGLPMQYHQQQQQDAQWQQHQQYQQEAARQQQQQQQQQAAAAAAAQQQYNQHLYLLSKAQQPHIPPQQLNRPLTRVPLRIPARPLYQTQGVQQQQQQPSTAGASNTSGSHTATVYDPSIGVSVTGTSATVIQPASATMPQQSQQTYTPASTMVPISTTGRRTPIVPSTDNAFPATPYSSQPQQQQQPARIITNPAQRPYDYTRPSMTDDPSSHVNIYPGQQQQPKQPAPPSAHVITPSVPSHANYIPPSATPSAVPQHMSSSSNGLRTTSLPSAGLEAPSVPPPQHINTMGSGLTAMATAPPLQSQQQQQASSPFYYNTPSATPTSSHPHHHSPHHVVSSDHHQPPPAFVNGTPSNTHFNTTYGNQSRHASRPATTTNNPVISHPGRPAYYMDPVQQQQQQQPVVVSQHQQPLAAPTNSMMDYSYGGTSTNSAMYGRPPMGRASSNPSYHNPYNVATGGPSPDHLQQQDHRPPASVSPYAKQPSAPKPTNGPVPEDPMTAAESYRVPSRK
ncbi:unnamed protein product [Absidia cylindrospora]